ncbi:hypothetical protein KFK09_021244 [Dendrobium nobile]|uniref:Uncharacterized protein n=1 Tax=Dendrobium nobile TaxID=94219 RepID=A0A8T3ANW0_DENNO|nr:hypothetical protein KFK09_021244 [Dendrobium nobile]
MLGIQNNIRFLTWLSTLFASMTNVETPIISIFSLTFFLLLLTHACKILSLQKFSAFNAFLMVILWRKYGGDEKSGPEPNQDVERHPMRFNANDMEHPN